MHYENFSFIINGSSTLAMFLRQKRQRQQHTTVTIVLALATLGGMTKIEMIR
jgi:hypothetical protein